MKKFVACISLFLAISGGVALAASNELVVATVLDNGQGSLPQNVATDQTTIFEMKYGNHDPRDQVMSDLSIYLIEGVLALVLLMALFEKKKTDIAKMNGLTCAK